MTCRWLAAFGWLLLVLASVPAEAGQDLLRDTGFERGFAVTPPARAAQAFATRKAVERCLRDCAQDPVWRLQQWATARDIAEGKTAGFQWVLEDGAGRRQKALQWQPGRSVMLELNGLSEFAAMHPAGEAHYLPDLRRPWPHWLVSQTLVPARLSGFRALPLRGEVTLLFDHPQLASGRDPGVHAARLVLAITVRNRLNGNYFWLTLPLYDDRHGHTGFGCQKCQGERCYIPQRLDDPGRWRCPEDRVGEQWWRNEKPGTARMLFRVPTQAFMGEPLVPGRTVSIRIDLLPYVQAGIEAVQQRENGARFPRDLFFYELGLFALGWEVTGFNHVAAELHGWQLQGEPKQ